MSSRILVRTMVNKYSLLVVSIGVIAISSATRDTAEFCTTSAIMKRVQTRWIWKQANVNIRLNVEPMARYMTNIRDQAVDVNVKISELIPEKYEKNIIPGEFEFGEQKLKIISRVPTLLHHQCKQISLTEHWTPFSPNPEELRATQGFFLKYGGGVEVKIVLNLFHLHDQMFNSKLEGLNNPAETNMKGSWETDGNGQLIGTYKRINNTDRYGWYYSNSPDNHTTTNIACVRKLQAWERSLHRLPFFINLQGYLTKGVGWIEKVDKFLKDSQKIGTSVDTLTRSKEGINYPEVTMWPTPEMTSISEILRKILDATGRTLITPQKVNWIRAFYQLASQLGARFTKAANQNKMTIPLAMPNMATAKIPTSNKRLIQPKIDYITNEHTKASDDYQTMGQATLYTADDSTEQTTYKIHTRILDDLDNGIAANYLVTTDGDKDYATTHLPTYTECTTMKEKIICQRAIRAVTPQEYDCGSQIAHSETIEACPMKKIEGITLTATNCSSYTVMINNPKGETITENCRGDTEGQNKITGIAARGTILLKSDCTVSVGKEQLILGDGEKQRRVHWDDMFSTLNKIGPKDQIVLPLLTIAGVAGGGCGFFLLIIILVIIAGCKGWHGKLWRKMLPIRKFCLCITCNCYEGSCSRCCGCLRRVEQKVQWEDAETPHEGGRKTRATRNAEQAAFFKSIRDFLSQSWDNVYEPPIYQNRPSVDQPLLGKIGPTADRPVLGPKPQKPNEMTAINQKRAKEGNRDDPQPNSSSAPPAN